jgi:hypothetical protein
MSLQTNLTNLATRVATECKSIRAALAASTGTLSSLTTTAKSNLVAAINELDADLAALSATAAGINDATTTTTSTWSSSKTNTAINALVADASASGAANTWSIDKIKTSIAAAKSELVNGAGAALDTLLELSAALGNDANFASTTATSLGNRIRVDAVQSFTAPQKAQACANIGVGDPETDFVTTFEAGLV